jgi:hypothetical protein
MKNLDLSKVSIIGYQLNVWVFLFDKEEKDCDFYEPLREYLEKMIIKCDILPETGDIFTIQDEDEEYISMEVIRVETQFRITEENENEMVIKVNVKKIEET